MLRVKSKIKILGPSQGLKIAMITSSFELKKSKMSGNYTEDDDLREVMY